MRKKREVNGAETYPFNYSRANSSSNFQGPKISALFLY
jgi:hypothetical protein